MPSGVANDERAQPGSGPEGPTSLGGVVFGGRRSPLGRSATLRRHAVIAVLAFAVLSALPVALVLGMDPSVSVEVQLAAVVNPAVFLTLLLVAALLPSSAPYVARTTAWLALVLMCHQSWLHLMQGAGGAELVGPVSLAAPWVPIAYLLAFAFLPTRQALAGSIVAYLATAVLAGWAVYGPSQRFPGELERGLVAGQYLTAPVMYLIVLVLMPAMRSEVESAQAVADAAVKRTQHVEAEAFTDALTGARNRRGTQKALELAVSLAEKGGSGLAIVLLDIDHFKQINDNHGHDVGDLVLIELVARLKGGVRGGDVVGRWGGEEFLIVLPTCGARSAGALAERLREAVDGERFPGAGFVTCSFGVAVWRAGLDAESLVQKADRALYDAKRSGRNRVCAAS